MIWYLVVPVSDDQDNLHWVQTGTLCNSGYCFVVVASMQCVVVSVNIPSCLFGANFKFFQDVVFFVFSGPGAFKTGQGRV